MQGTDTVESPAGIRPLRLRVWLLILLAPLVLSSLAACSSPASIDPTGATVIDVRTPAEFAEGHLAGAVNIDVQAAGFRDQVASLDKQARYILYCRSGSRAGTALSDMEGWGFTDVTNAGGLSDASRATGLDIVK